MTYAWIVQWPDRYSDQMTAHDTEQEAAAVAGEMVKSGRVRYATYYRVVVEDGEGAA